MKRVTGQPIQPWPLLKRPPYWYRWAMERTEPFCYHPWPLVVRRAFQYVQVFLLGWWMHKQSPLRIEDATKAMVFAEELLQVLKRTTNP